MSVYRPNPGHPVMVSGRGDLGIVAELRALIDVPGVTFVRITKAGLARVAFNGVEYSVPQRNLYAPPPPKEERNG